MVEVRKHKSERDLQAESKKNDTIGRRSIGDRLDTFRGRLSTSMREDNVEQQQDETTEEGNRRSGAQSRADTIRATSPLPNFTLFDLPSGTLSGPLNGDLEINDEEETPRDEMSHGRRSFNIFRPSFDRGGNRARASKDGRLNFTRVEPSIANRSTILSRADDAINTEEKSENKTVRKTTYKSVTPKRGSSTPSTQVGHTFTPYTHDGQSVDEEYDDERIRKASKKALWKTDLVIMPLMALVVMLQYLDKVSSIEYNNYMNKILTPFLPLLGNLFLCSFTWLSNRS